MRKRPFFLLAILVLLFLTPQCPPPEPPPPPEIIEVEVCSDSELLPNEYCPEIEIIEFEKGTEPTKICDSCEKPYTICEWPVPEVDKFIGYSFGYENLSLKWRKENFTPELWEEVAEAIAQNANAHRTFAYCSEGDWYLKHSVMPFKKLQSGKYDLNELSEDYKALVHAKLDPFIKRKVTTLICLLTSIKGSRFETCPLNGKNNINGTTTAHSQIMDDKQTIKMTKIYFRLMIKEFDSPYVHWEFINEPRFGQNKQNRWYKQMTPFLNKHGVPNERIHIGYSGMGSCIYMWLDMGHWVAWHGGNSQKTMWKRRQSSSRWAKYQWGRYYGSGDGFDTEFKQARGIIRWEQAEKDAWHKHKAAALQMRQMIHYDLHILEIKAKKDDLYGNGHEFMSNAAFAWKWFEHYPNLRNVLKISLDGLTAAEANELNVSPADYKEGELINIRKGHAGRFPEGRNNPPPRIPGAEHGSCNPDYHK